MSSDRDALWAELMETRERATRVALARGAARDDVDDIVQEALARVAAMPNVDLARVGPLVTVVVANLVTDAYRSAARASRAAPRLAEHASRPPEEEILDRAEARWLWSRRVVLGDQDRRVLELRAQGLTVDATASALGVTYKAADRAFSRARSRMREVWRATAAAIGLLAARPGRRTPGQATTAAVFAVATAVLALLPVTHDTPDAEPVPPPVQLQRAMTSPFREPLPIAVGQRGAVGPGQAAARIGGAAPAGAPDRREAATGPVTIGKLGTSGVTVRERARDESFQETVQRCLDQGVEVSPTYVGCGDYPAGAGKGVGSGGAGTQYVPPGHIWVDP